MLQLILNIARFTLLEGWRGRLIAIVVAVIVIAVICAEFAAGLAITESNSFRIAIYAGFCRIALVFIVMLFAATSVVRELNERMLDLTLSRPVSRASWMCGRLLGLWMLGGIAAVLCCLPLLAVLAPATVVVWGVFFAIELAIVATATMTCVVTLRHVTLAVTVAAAFYVLSRSIDALLLMSRGPTVDPDAWSTEIIAQGLALLALVLPALDRFTNVHWLLESAGSGASFVLVGEGMVYILFLLAIGLFDFYRVDV
jgi:Cu-processing system permease protein